MAGHIPILRPGGDNIVPTGAALTQPGLEAAAVTAQLPCRSRVRQAVAATDTPAGARSGASAHRDKDVSTVGSQATPPTGRACRPRAPPAFRTVDPAGSDVAEPRAGALATEPERARHGRSHRNRSLERIRLRAG
ncbi:hypothetical protein GAR06_00038 [Micromonospora saelicesensis]|uniref:Uncharacterized protein n=1 Tax=Micromonospora saelicesensis TaxID=285676 RepID=A0A1C5ADY6_9ACTN|nr:hypothetical protein GAR05_02088 [Micromonospora saelicesensis]RAO50752.1 hypothetical protein GAR06_00038 [Micromonospora saelicesensis]SCF43445.1 hypothetical protein GA0070561_0073 [Micromonospora saelicesensis]